MTVQRIALEGFRNYRNFTAEFSPGVNLIVGDNAQGKTNLLEAVAYLSTASSHRARYDRELIQFGTDQAGIKAAVSAREREFVLEARLSRGARRRLWSNGVTLKTAAELSGILHTVLFCPEDLYLIREGAAVRRRFLDSCICQLRPRYAAALAEYRKLHAHKTRILRDFDQKPSLLDTLDEFSHGMARAGALIVHYRAHFIRRLGETALPIHQEFSGGGETFSLRYETVKTVEQPEAPPKELLPQLLAHMERHRKAELEARQCLSGPHKDDVTVEIDGQSAKAFASQGQTRTAALSLKLASREIFFQETGEWPVLLLDDVLSELDRRRQSFVLGRIRGGQVLITSCHGDHPEGLLHPGKTIHIKHGALASP